jgi:hypothetical protein
MINASGAGSGASAASDEGFGNRADSRGNVPPPSERSFEVHETDGNSVEAIGNTITGFAAEIPAAPGTGPRAKGPRGRQRRNFRGRGGRNRGPKGGGEGGSGGGGDGGPSAASGGSEGGGNGGNTGGEGNS